MKFVHNLTLLLLAGLASAAPPTCGRCPERIVVTKDFYPSSFVKYQSEHEIVNLLLPLNELNFDEDTSSSEETDAQVTLFFVEADIDADKKRTYKGLYVLKNNKATKILENGRDAAASADDSNKVYFGAQDGIYVYKADTNEAVKYGPVTDSIIGIAKANQSDIIYILTEDHEVFKVTDSGNTKTKVNEVVNAQQIVLDYENNLYFYADDKQPFVLTADGIKKIDGLPANPTEVTLIKPPFIIEDGVPAIVDNSVYIIYANGTSEITDFEFKPKAKPSAYAMEGTLIQYYAYDKKIYEYNILVMILSDIMDTFKEFLENKTDEIQELANKTRRNKKE